MSFFPGFTVIFSVFMRYSVLTLEKPERVYLKCVLRGDPALIVLELKERWIVGSVREAVVQGLFAFYENILEKDLRRAQVASARRIAEEG
jgi:hypothetical protein